MSPWAANPARLRVHLRHQRPGGVHRLQTPVRGLFPYRRGHAVRGEHTTESSGTSFSSWTNTAPRDSRSRTTWVLWTTYLRTNTGRPTGRSVPAGPRPPRWPTPARRTATGATPAVPSADVSLAPTHPAPPVPTRPPSVALQRPSHPPPAPQQAHRRQCRHRVSLRRRTPSPTGSHCGVPAGRSRTRPVRARKP